MNYTLQLIKKQQQKTSQWSGGTTTELFIYPKNASYADRNFKWRLSSAKVEMEESNFTYLKGIWRWIMTLEGEIKLFHEGHGEKALKPLEPHSFSGEWNTKSIGKVRDFNLMLAEGCSGEIDATIIHKDMAKEISMYENKIQDNNFSKVTYALYCVKGKILLRTFYDEVKIDEGELLLINCHKQEQEDTSDEPNLYMDIHNNGDEDAIVVNSIIYQN